MGTLLLLGLGLLFSLLATPAFAAADPPADPRVVNGVVTSATGVPLQGILVFAVDPASDAIVATAASDDEGRLTMALRPRPHNFGVMSAHYGVQRLISKGVDRFDLVLTALPEGGATTTTAAQAKMPVIRSARMILIRGRVIDEGGQGLAGVRVDAVRAVEIVSRPEGPRAIGRPIATAISGSGGIFTVVIPAGDTQIQARAPGLAVVGSAVQRENGRVRADRPVLVMGVVAEAQDVIVTNGRVLRVRLQDSIDPEYTPPAALRAWLLFAYGICPATQPLRAREKQALKKYWYLDVLRREPPNPASVSTTGCVPAYLADHALLTVRIGLGSAEQFDYEREQK
jgi:hypothetical protein